MNTRIPHALLAAGTAALLMAACRPAPKEDKVAAAPTKVAGTVEFWHFFTDREAAAHRLGDQGLPGAVPRHQGRREVGAGRHQDDPGDRRRQRSRRFTLTGVKG